MESDTFFLKKIILIILLVCMGVISTHFYLDVKNKNNCMTIVKKCKKGFKKYSYSSRYIGKCKCNVVCNDE